MTEQLLPDVRHAAAYGRLSEQDDPNNTDSVDGQLERALAHIGRRGWDDVGTFRDDDVSAYSGRPRPGYDRLMAEIVAGRVDTVVVRHLDRLWRDDLEAAQALRILSKHAVMVVEYGGMEYPTWTAIGRKLIRDASGDGTYESDRKSERVKEAAERRAKEGRMNGVCPYGWRREYERAPSGRVVRSWEVEDPEAADVVREITRRLLAGDTLIGITKDLNERKVPAPGAAFEFRHKGRAYDNADGTRWNKTSVKKLALRSTNAAIREHEGTEYPGRWPALVPVEDWRKVRALLEAQQKKTAGPDGRDHLPRPGRREHLLTWGIGFCGKCEGYLRTAMRGGRRGGQHYSYYVCAVCGNTGRREAYVDEYVGAVVVERLSRPDALSWLAPDGQELAEAAARAADARELLRVAGKKLVSKQWDQETVDAINEDTRPILERAEADIRRLSAAADHSALIEIAGPEAEKRWAEAPLTVKRKILEALGITVLLLPIGGHGPGFNPDSVEIRWAAGQ